MCTSVLARASFDLCVVCGVVIAPPYLGPDGIIEVAHVGLRLVVAALVIPAEESYILRGVPRLEEGISARNVGVDGLDG